MLSLNYAYLCVLLAFLEDSLLTQSSQVQAAEDILDKYRNIKRTSPSNGATGGTSYDGTGGKTSYVRLLNILGYMHMHLICPHCYMSSDLCGEDGVPDSMQNISTDDLPDSASQTAQQHDSKFSFRSISRWCGNRFLIFQPPVFYVVVFFLCLFLLVMQRRSWGWHCAQQTLWHCQSWLPLPQEMDCPITWSLKVGQVLFS